MGNPIPKPGDPIIDASDIKLVDLAKTKIKNLSKTRAGYESAVASFVLLSSALIERIGMDPALQQKAQELLATDKRCTEVLPASTKLTALIRETRLDARHQIAGLLSEVGAQARRRAERDPKGDEIIAALEVLLEYQSASAKKAVATRGKGKAKAAKAKKGEQKDDNS